jgi:DNA mismatch repair protein MutS2
VVVGREEPPIGSGAVAAGPVDDAALAGLASVRVVHGRGTGALRSTVRDELRQHAFVESQEPDSADGATVVHLAR